MRESIFLILLILDNTLAWDGCHFYSWRCGDTCIYKDTKCSCGGKIFKKEDGKWCCQDSPCTGKGEDYYEDYDEDYVESWSGGADCTGTALNLTQPCNERCNYYKDDEWRNLIGVLRGGVKKKTGIF